MLVKNMYTAGEVLRSTGGYSLSLIIWLGGGMYCFVEPLSGDLRCTGSCSLAEPTLIPWRVEQLDCSDNSFIASVSSVTCN